jgi:hypothetical protein
VNDEPMIADQDLAIDRFSGEPPAWSAQKRS